MLDYLVVAAHPDDAELGMGGTISLLLSQGHRVGILDLTDGEPTPHGSPEIRQLETSAASAALGVTWRENLGLPNRSLQPDLPARRLLAGVLRRTRPRVIFAHHWEDSHPEHVAASALTDAARFWAKLTKTDLPGEPHYPEHIYYYFSVHLRIQPPPTFVMDISKQLETKLRALGCYQSQFLAGRPAEAPSVLDAVRTRASYWGWAIGAAYGEPFVSREPLGVTGLSEIA
jgi:bacillithiol biosynthesis deacetylase BshB1